MVADVVVLVHIAACGLLALFGVHRVWLLTDFLRGRRARPAPKPAESLPFVTVQLPLFNEREVAGRLIDAVCRQGYPRDRFEVQVLDDSTDDTVAAVARAVDRWAAEGVQIAHVRRDDRVGFKAGALAHGLDEARGELVAIFDADFVPHADFLASIVPAFDDPEVGMVQARWGHLNRGSNWLTLAQAVFLDAHFTIEHAVRNARGRFFNFNGTAGVWRRTAIDKAGGWDSATLTEDLDLSFRAQLSGTRFAYLDHVEVPAELPDDINAFKTQQHRWAKGSLQTARRLLPSVWRADLPLAVKVDATLKLLQNTAFLVLAVVVLTMPAVSLMRAMGAGPLERAADFFSLGLATLPVALHFLVAQRARGRSWLETIVAVPLALGLGGALSFNNARAAIEGISNTGSNVFVRTPKAGEKKAASYRSGVHPLVFVELITGIAHLTVATTLVVGGAAWTTPFLWMFGICLVALSGASLYRASPIPRLSRAR
jgi:hypothetical protein